MRFVRSVMMTTVMTPTTARVGSTTRPDRRVGPVRKTMNKMQTQRRGWIILARSASNDDDSTVTANGGRRGLMFGAAIATATMALTANAARADGFGEAYVSDTLATLEAAQRLAKGSSSDEAADRALVDGWVERNKKRYNAKTQGKSYLMTTKVVTLLKGKYSASSTLAAATFNEDKFDEWTEYARGFTDGSLTGKAAREAYGSAVWGNYDKTDPKNRIGLCVFGATPPTEALGINCSGF